MKMRKSQLNQSLGKKQKAKRKQVQRVQPKSKVG